jgi:hypothetical protein
MRGGRDLLLDTVLAAVTGARLSAWDWHAAAVHDAVGSAFTGLNMNGCWLGARLAGNEAFCGPGGGQDRITDLDGTGRVGCLWIELVIGLAATTRSASSRSVLGGRPIALHAVVVVADLDHALAQPAATDAQGLGAEEAVAEGETRVVVMKTVRDPACAPRMPVISPARSGAGAGDVCQCVVCGVSCGV